MSLQEAKRHTEVLRGRLLDIDLKLRTGELVERAAVDRKRFAEGRLVRDRIRAIPSRIAADLYACASVAEVQRTLARAIDVALEDCASELR